MKNEVMFQVQVTNAMKQDVQVGPAVSDKRVLEPLIEAINLSVASGKQKDWRDARIVQIHKLH